MENTKTQKLKIEIIDWVDSKIEIGEADIDEMHNWANMSSIGFVVYEDISVVTLAQDLRCEEDTYRTTITIPKVCISNRRVIKLNNK